MAPRVPRVLASLAIVVAFAYTRPAGGMMRVPTSPTLDDAADCAGQPAGTVCRAVSGPCDVAEACDGIAPDCPPDAVLDARTVCRPAAGPCDLEEHCVGDTSCPADIKSIAVCRQALGRCDVAERCDGVADACPADAVQPASFRLTCDDVHACTTGDRCSGVSGDCQPRLRVVCDDPCHTGACDARDGCVPRAGAKALTCRVARCAAARYLPRMRRLARRIDRSADADRPPQPQLLRRLAKLLERCARDGAAGPAS